MRTQAAVLSELGGTFTLEDIDVDDPRPGEVLVHIEAVGVCHTDLAARDGILPLAFPAVVGHEGAGTVLAVGNGVSKVAAGDRVAVTFSSCGTCTLCASGHPAHCLDFAALNYGGVRADGSTPLSKDSQPVGGLFFGQSSFARAALTSENNVVRVDAGIPFEHLAPLGCGVQTGVGAVTRVLRARDGSSIAVTGGGSVGLSAVMGAVLAGCSTIIVVEPSERRRQLAKELGATDVIDPADGDVTEQIRGIIASGVDYGVDTTAVPAVIEGLIAASATRGTVALVGVPADPTACVSLNMMTALGLGVTVTTVIEGDSLPGEFIPELVELVTQGRLPVDKLVTTFPLDDVNEAVRAQLAGEVVKPVLLT